MARRASSPHCTVSPWVDGVQERADLVGGRQGAVRGSSLRRPQRRPGQGWPGQARRQPTREAREASGHVDSCASSSACCEGSSPPLRVPPPAARRASSARRQPPSRRCGPLSSFQTLPQHALLPHASLSLPSAVAAGWASQHPQTAEEAGGRRLARCFERLLSAWCVP